MFQVKAKDQASFGELIKLTQNGIYDFWTEPRSTDQPIDVMVPPAYAETFVHLLKSNNVDYRVKIADVQA